MKSKMLWPLLTLLALVCAVSFFFRSDYVVSVLSLCVAVTSFVKTNSIEKRMLQIEEERRSEEKAASLIAYAHKSEKVKELRIENKGKGDARNITVLLDGIPLDEQHPLWYRRQPQPTTELSGNEHRDYILCLRRSALPETAKIHWDDDARKGNVKVCQLHF
jgi:uncharacterized membrane protein